MNFRRSLISATIILSTACTTQTVTPPNSDLVQKLKAVTSQIATDSKSLDSLREQLYIEREAARQGTPLPLDYVIGNDEQRTIPATKAEVYTQDITRRLTRLERCKSYLQRATAPGGTTDFDRQQNNFSCVGVPFPNSAFEIEYVPIARQ